MEEQALHGEGAVDENRVAAMSRRLAEGRERLEKMQVKSMREFHKYQRDVDSQMELLKWMEEQQVAWARERESMESELRKLRSEVEQLQAAAVLSASPQICDIDRGSEEIDLKALAEHKWNASRQALAPITPEVVRARTKQGALGVSGVATSGKENILSDPKSAEEIQRLRRENEHWKQKASRLSKENKGLKSQYNYLQTRLGSKGDVGHLIPDQDRLLTAVDAGLRKPSKIRRRNPGETQTQEEDARSSSSISSEMNGPSIPVADSGILPPQAVAEVVTGPTASTSGSRDPQAEIKAEPVHLESFKPIIHIPSTKNIAAAGLDAGFEGKPDQAIDYCGMQHCSLLTGAVRLVQLPASKVESLHVSALSLASLLQAMAGFSFVKC